MNSQEREVFWQTLCSLTGNSEEDVHKLRQTIKVPRFLFRYDLDNGDNFLCGKQEKCANCGIKNFGTPLYPIYYSDQPYDATNFVKFVMLHKLEELTRKPMPQSLYELMGSDLWEREKTRVMSCRSS